MSQLRDTIKSIVDPIKDAVNFVGREIIKPVVTLGGTFEIEESLTLASVLAGVPGYDDMSEQEQANYINAYHQSRANALAQQMDGKGSSFLDMGSGMSRQLLQYGVTEKDFTQTGRTGQGGLDELGIKNIIENSLGQGVQINDFSRANELNAFTEAFRVDPELGKEDYSDPTIKIGDE